jgi:adenine-specific DNA-methyltransferase
VLATIVWVSNLKGRQISDAGPAGTHEYILCFARDRSQVGQFRGSAAELRELMPAVYKGPAYEVKHDEKGPYVTKNELYNTNSKFNELTAPTMVFKLHFHPDTGEVRVTDLDDETTFPGFLVALPHPNARPGLRWHAWRWSRAKVLAEHDELEFEVTGDTFRVRTKIRDVDGMTLKDVVIGPSTMTAQADLEALGLRRAFETPKPVALLEILIGATTSGDDVVLDFFAGSATTAHAVLARNHRDGGSRRFVVAQRDEPCAAGSAAAAEGFASIDAIGRERIRRAGAALRADGFTGDVGFRALRVAER